MSDELTIQGVNPQQQYPVQKTSTMPYTLGGAAIGAAAGWAGTSMAKSKGPAKTLEELVQEANGQDKVELTSKKAALEKAEKESQWNAMFEKYCQKYPEMKPPFLVSS